MAEHGVESEAFLGDKANFSKHAVLTDVCLSQHKTTAFCLPFPHTQNENFSIEVPDRGNFKTCGFQLPEFPRQHGWGS